jgi:hypothetical protein
MTTSGNYGFVVNRDQILRMAALNLGRLDELEQLSPQETIDMSVWLNMLVKQWMGKADFAPGLKAFSRRRGHLFLSGITGTYPVNAAATGWTNLYIQTTCSTTVGAGATAIPAVMVTGMTIGDKIGIDQDAGTIYWSTILSFTGNTINITGTVTSQATVGASIYTYTTAAQQPLFIETASLRDFQGNDVPLTLMTSQQYDLLPNKQAPTNTGDPVAIYYDDQLGTGYIRTDVAGASDLSKHIIATYFEPCQDFTNAADTPYFPQEWYLPLALETSKLCAPMFRVSWTPLMQETAATALRIAQNKDTEVETAYYQSGT